MYIETSETHWVYRDGRPVYRHADVKVAGNRATQEINMYPASTVELRRERKEIGVLRELKNNYKSGVPDKRDYRKRA